MSEQKPSWIKLHRKLVNSSVWMDSSRLRIWIYILFETNFADASGYYHGRLIKVKRGECVTSLREIAKTCFCTTKTAKRVLNQFQEDGMLTYESLVGWYTLIKVTNYKAYQGKKPPKSNTNDYIDDYIDDHINDYNDDHNDDTLIRSNNYIEEQEYKNMASPDENSEDDQLDAEYEEDEDEYAGYVIPQKDEDGNWIDPEW